MSALKTQQGLSMIELLVTLLIGSFLVLGITQIYIDNRRSYAFQQSQGENQESSRYALLLLQQQLEKVGYRRLTDDDWTKGFPEENITALGCNFPEGRAVIWNNTNSSLCIRYQPRTNTERDCLGNTIAGIPATPSTATTILFSERIWFDAANSRLMCASTTQAAAGELISGVAGLVFEFGVGNQENMGSGVKTDKSDLLDHYVKQEATADTDDIVVVRYKALMRSSGGKVRDTSDDSPVLARWQTLTGVADSAIEALQGDDSGQIYQISQSTIMLRNLMP